MNLKQFTKTWIDKAGISKSDADYGGMMGEAVIELIEVLSKQGHSGYSAGMVVQIFSKINQEYNSGDSEIWKDYWKSKEGKKLLAEHDMKPEDMIKDKQ